MRSAGLITLSPDEVTAQAVGIKGFGLAAIPQPWCSPFLAIDANVGLPKWQPSTQDLLSFLAFAGVPATGELIVRSSGTDETLAQRGRLDSRTANVDNLVAIVRELAASVPADVVGAVHWIVQEKLPTRRQGHLSNERRLKYEKRDWLVEKEASPTFGVSSESFGIRRWRDGRRLRIAELACLSEKQIQKALRWVAIWATQFDERFHFEWIWDGKRVILVQLDLESVLPGCDPKKLVSRTRLRQVAPKALTLFAPATDEHYASTRKLKNAALYRNLGYTMPPFFVLDDKATIKELMNGTVSESLMRDLADLTKRPLIIRTDGDDLPADKREMLPRSDELRNCREAVRWLSKEFPRLVAKGGLGDYRLKLLAHHFIPSLASAWARATPNSPIVRIEALWGIPEGLYYHAHDVYEVDVANPHIGHASYDGQVFKKNVRKRFKGVFVAPDDHGKWVVLTTDARCAWHATITDDHILGEIAWVTKQIAQSVGDTVAVMWFVGNHKDATQHYALPWYHETCQLQGTPKAAPTKKWRTSSDYPLTTTAEWEGLQQSCSRGERIERVTLKPVDPNLIRDPVFAETLGRLSKELGFVVELSGGILSHVYYTLVREGARVECVDLYGNTEETTEYFKLVRDRLPEMIRERGESCGIVQLREEAHTVGLRRKLMEEALEALDSSSTEELANELADVLEVVRALARSVGVRYQELERRRRAKAEKRGGFDKGYMLTITETPGTLTQRGTVEEHDVRVYTEVPQIPARPHYRRPDTRQVDDSELERLLTIEAELSSLNDEVRETMEFPLPGSQSESSRLAVVVALRRRGGSIRATVRLKRVPRQLDLPFDAEAAQR